MTKNALCWIAGTVVVLGLLVWLLLSMEQGAGVQDATVPEVSDQAPPVSGVEMEGGSVSGPDAAGIESPVPGVSSSLPSRTLVEGEEVGSADEPSGGVQITVVARVDGEALAVANHSVRVVPWERRSAAWRVRPVVSNASGEVEVLGLCAGRYRLIALQGHGDFVDVDVVAGAITSAQIELRKSMAIVGVVRDADNNPIAGAGVGLRRLDSGACLQIVTVTGDDGAFEIAHAPGFVSVLATKAGFLPCSPKILASGQQPSPARADFVLTRGGGAIRGRVMRVDGSPEEGALVQVGDGLKVTTMRTAGVGSRRVYAGEDGSFVIEGLAPGIHPLKVVQPGFAAFESECEILAGTAVSVDVVLREAGVCRGRVATLAEGGSFKGITVRHLGKYPFLTNEVPLRDDGTYVLEDLPLGSVKLTAGSAAFGFAHAEIWIAGDGKDAQWSPTLLAPATLRGRVLDDATSEGVQVALMILAMDRGDGDSYVRYVQSDAEGFFEVERVPADSTFAIMINQGVQSPVITKDVVPGGDGPVIRVVPK